MDESKSWEEAEKDTSIYCRNWDQINTVAQFLNVTLVDITLGLAEGIFASTGPELSSLVVAYFKIVRSEDLYSTYYKMKINCIIMDLFMNLMCNLSLYDYSLLSYLVID